MENTLERFDFLIEFDLSREPVVSIIVRASEGSRDSEARGSLPDLASAFSERQR